MERRDFLKKLAAFSLGCFALLKGLKAWAKGLPSDPGRPTVTTKAPDIIDLPFFEKDSGFPLDQALLIRKSSRSYDSEKAISQEQLSRLLWATAGMNRTECMSDGGRTLTYRRTAIWSARNAVASALNSTS